MKNIFTIFAIIFLSSTLVAQIEKSNLSPDGIKTDSTAKTYTELNNLGVKAVIDAQNNELALEYFNEALKANPECFICKTNIGRANLRLGNLDEAITIFNELLKVKPDSAEVWASLGEALNAQQEFEESRKASEKAIDLGLEDPITFTNYAISLKSLGERKKALKYLDKSLALNESFAETHSNRGVVLFEMGNFKKALISLNEANKLMPNNANILNNIGVTLDSLGKRREARESYQAAIDSDANFPIAQYNLAANFLEVGERDMAYKKLNLLKTMDVGLANKLQQMIWGKFVVNISNRKIGH